MDRRYRAIYAELLLEHMSRGHSLESFAALKNDTKKPVTPTTVAAWLKSHEDFAQAYEKGMAATLLFFEKKLLDTRQNSRPVVSRALLNLYRSCSIDVTRTIKQALRETKKSGDALSLGKPNNK